MRPTCRPALLGLFLGPVLAACATQPARVAAPAAPPVAAAPAPRPAACTSCGRIERMDIAPADDAAKPRGAVLGGVVGGVLSKPAPAAAGTAPASRNVRLVVLLDSGRRLILTQPAVPGMKVGSRVRVDRSRAVLLR